MKIKIYCLAFLIAFCTFFTNCIAQNLPYTSSFIGRMGVDTVLVETYSMINNHLYGKSFIRVPEDYIGEFSIHFYPDGSIREFNIVAMDPLNSSVPFKATSGSFEYRLNMNCINDTCTFYKSHKNIAVERIYKHPAKNGFCWRMGTSDFFDGVELHTPSKITGKASPIKNDKSCYWRL